MSFSHEGKIPGTDESKAISALAPLSLSQKDVYQRSVMGRHHYHIFLLTMWCKQKHTTCQSQKGKGKVFEADWFRCSFDFFQFWDST